MSYLVVGTKADQRWDIEVQGVGKTHAETLAGIEPAVRELLSHAGKVDAADADLQLLMPDFEVDLNESLLPRGDKPYLELLSGLIALVVVVGAIAYVIGRLS
ncbi:MAG: hypothetical protein ABIR57_05235 [Aeromicrobium sp.]